MIVDHTDEPGVVGSVTRVLGECSINIAFMRVFRKERGGKRPIWSSKPMIG